MDAHEISLPQGLIDVLRIARHVTVLTGAGISAESGLPTFRDPMTGLWANYRPEELATPEAFLKNPRLVWEWYAWRRELVEQATPNAGHRALVTIERRVPEFILLTQNVDSLHQRAGSRNVVELHGNILRTKCFGDNQPVDSWQEDGEVPPRCPRCGDMLRPDVVWFGEQLPPSALEAAVEAATFCNLFLSIGTSGMVEPAASLSRVAEHFGAKVAFINLEVSPLEEPQRYHINGQAGLVLPALIRAAWPDETL